MVVTMARERPKLCQNPDTMDTTTRGEAMVTEVMEVTTARERPKLCQNPDTMDTTTRGKAMVTEDIIMVDSNV